jgi:putative ABC transport system permease protein
VLSYALKDLLRNSGRTLAAFAGVALAVALVAATAFFVDASAARMTQRAIAPVAIDMQAVLTAPLASPLQLTETLDHTQGLNAGQSMTITLTAINGSTRAMTNVVVKDEASPPLAYAPGSTALNGSPVSDAAGEMPLLSGLQLGSLAFGARATITYRVQATAAVPSTQALRLHGSVASAEEPAWASANAAPALSTTDLAARALKVPGVQSADVLGAVDLAAGSLRAGATVLGQPVRVMAVNPDYLQHYQLITLASGQYSADSALLSVDAASGLGVVAGQTAALSVPGRTAPIMFKVGGIADFSHADALFVSRSPDTQGEFAPLSNVIMLPVSTFETTVLPALRVDAASAAPQLKSAPYLELDLHLDRSRLNSDPTVAVVSTQALKRSIERVAPGQVGVIDNLSESLTTARADTILAKILFLFLGLPGVLLAAYLARYAGGLLAEAQRRERGILRARGAQPRHLVSALAYTTVAVAVIGAPIGLAIGAAVVAAILGPAALQTASLGNLGVSAAAAVGAGLLTTALAFYVPGRRALYREANDERRELPVSTTPIWLRMRIDLVLLAAAAVVWFITVAAGGFKPTTAEGQSVSLSFYTLLAPMLGWLGATLFGVRLLLLAGRQLSSGKRRQFKGAASGILRRSVQRRSMPLASAVIAVGLAVGFGSSLLLLVSTYDAEKSADARFVVGADIRVTPSAAVPQQGAFANRLQVPGVTAVTSVAQTSSAIVGTDKRALVAIDAPNFAKVATLPDSFFSGISARAAISALQNDPAAVLTSTELARTFNVQPGDQVRVELPGSAGKPVPVTFHAAGTFINFPGFPQGIDLVGNLSFFQNATGSQRADVFLIKATDPSPDSLTRITQALRAKVGPANPVQIETTATAINRDASSLTALNMRGLGSLEALFAVAMSAIGIAIFVFGLLLQRRKEFVTMRALGMGLSQLRALVVGEAAIVAVLSLVIGGLVGAAMALMFVQVLTPLFTIPPTGLNVPIGTLGLLATLVLGGVGLSSLAASRILRRLNPAELLREE